MTTESHVFNDVHLVTKNNWFKGQGTVHISAAYFSISDVC